MAKGNVEDQLAGLTRLRQSPVTDATLDALRKGLAAKVNLVAAKAAEVTASLNLKPMIPDLLAAFDRCFKNGDQTDPQCWAKNALAQALITLDHDESAPFLRGCYYRQMESVWGRRVDTAGNLRSLCTLALLQCADLTRAAKFRHLVAVMTDPEETVRIDAIRAVEQMEGEEAILLLRLKAGMGDQRAPVTGQALESLLRLEGEAALEFAKGFLMALEPGGDEVVEEAALALGASRLPTALEALKEAWDHHHRSIFLQAISASRLETGFAFLLSLVGSGPERDAAAALGALALHRDSPPLRAAVLAAVEARGSPALSERFHPVFTGF